MCVDQFRDYSDMSDDVKGLKLRARLFEVGAQRARSPALASKLYDRSRRLARRAHALETAEMRFAR